jgi:hypothetical protein
MLEGSTKKRSQLRKGTNFSKTCPKGFLKLAREKLERQKTYLNLDAVEEDPSPIHMHKRSQSSTTLSYLSTGSNTPNIAYIRQPVGDFCDYEFS